MYIRKWLHPSAAFVTLLVLILAFGVQRSSADETSHYVQSEHPNQPDIGSSLPPALNQLMIGCNQAGAISYLLHGRRLELIYSGLGDADGEPAKRYDEVYVLRLANRDDTWSSEKICLYFRGGYLAFKCIVPDKEVNPNEVFRREIVSGLQHPPNFPGFMDKVRWGEAAEPHIETLNGGRPEHGEKTKQRAALPKVRCGIALDGLPPSVAKEKGTNVVVLFQNVGPSALSDDLLLIGFPIGPVIAVSADYRSSSKGTGFPSYFGFYGTKLYRIPFNNDVMDCRSGAFRLEPGECTFAWFRVPDLKSYAAVQGVLDGIWGATKEGENVSIRVWDAASEKINISQ